MDRLKVIPQRVTDHGVLRWLPQVSDHRVLQMQGSGCAGVLPVLQVPANATDAVPCDRLRLKFINPT
ncbi:MAG: hypothetical protein DSZ23_05995 [Thermodesulfatator sp.]|nr:MAG: hypothetical protein DSZ23_05995 [Thermodesulfatator sp.]